MFQNKQELCLLTGHYNFRIIQISRNKCNNWIHSLLVIGLKSKIKLSPVLKDQLINVQFLRYIFSIDIFSIDRYIFSKDYNKNSSESGMLTKIRMKISEEDDKTFRDIFARRHQKFQRMFRERGKNLLRIGR